MCCSSGVCGPNPDQGLMEFQNTLEELKKIGIKVERYIITQSPEMFKQNPKVLKLIQEQQIIALPITTLGGDIVKSESYPTLDEFKKFSNKK